MRTSYINNLIIYINLTPGNCIPLNNPLWLMPLGAPHPSAAYKMLFFHEVVLVVFLGYAFGMLNAALGCGGPRRKRSYGAFS